MTKSRILLCEDEYIVAKDIETSLKNLGYYIAGVVHSGEEAIKKAEETFPDLILMDILLKGHLNGIEATGQIKQKLDIPVIYLTAYSDQNTIAKAKQTHPEGYILKPFEERELHTAIEMALNNHKKKSNSQDEKNKEIVELKKEINDLLSKLNLPAKYPNLL
jgi:two-component system, response regulator PdtaR